MSDLITFKSDQYCVDHDCRRSHSLQLKNGLNLEWSGQIEKSNARIQMRWKFHWNWLNFWNFSIKRINRLYAQITVKSSDNYFETHTVEADLKEKVEVVDTIIHAPKDCGRYHFTYELSLYPYREEQLVSFDKVFLPSDQNDAILVVEGKKLHVNKAFLSYHSEFFRDLFSTNFKEGQMDEIPINDVTYKDFCLFLACFHKTPVFPNDETVEIILKMAYRFKTPSVIGIAEHHLLNMSKIKNEKMMWLADFYRMSNLAQKAISRMNSVEKVKELNASPEYEKLSSDTKAIVLDRLLGLL